MSIFDPAYQNYINENYDPDDEENYLTDEEITEAQREYESNQAVEKCTECSAAINVYVGRDSDAFDWKEVFREPETEQDKKLLELDPLSFYDREQFIKPEYLICGACKAKNTDQTGADDEDEILF